MDPLRSIPLQRMFGRAGLAAVLAGAVAALSVSSVFASGEVGSGGGGGGGSTLPPVLAPCAQLSSFKASGGNYKIWGAIWVDYTVKNCGPAESLIVTVTETNTSTGNVDWISPATTYLSSNASFSMKLDNDFAPQATTYLVTITVTEYSSGIVLATQSVYTTTGTRVGP